MMTDDELDREFAQSPDGGLSDFEDATTLYQRLMAEEFNHAD